MMIDEEQLTFLKSRACLFTVFPKYTRAAQLETYTFKVCLGIQDDAPKYLAPVDVYGTGNRFAYASESVMGAAVERLQRGLMHL